MDVSKIYAKVEDAIKRKNFDFSIEMLKNQILKFNPNDVKARKLLRATVLEKYKINGFPNQMQILSKGLVSRIKITIGKMLKKWEMVVDEAENYLEYDPKNIGVLYILGEASMEAGYIDTAISVFENILAFNSSYVNALKALGKVYFVHKKELEKANQYYQRAARLAPNDIESTKMVKDLSAQITAHTYGKADSSRDLIRDKDKAKELEDDHATLRTDEDIQKAIERSQQKIAGDPSNKKELRRLADLYQKLGQCDNAIEILNKLLEMDPGNSDTKAKIGDCKLLQMENNINIIKENLKKAPQNQALKQKLQQSLQARNDFQIQDYEIRIKNQPLNYELRFKLGIALFQAKRFDDAISNFQQAIQDPRNRVAAYHYMGQAFGLKQEYELAAEQYKSALEILSPNDTQYREIKYNLGVAYELLKHYKDAIEIFTEIYKVDISYKDVQERLKKLREMAG